MSNRYLQMCKLPRNVRNTKKFYHGDRYIPCRLNRVHPYQQNTMSKKTKINEIQAAKGTIYQRQVYYNRLESVWNLNFDNSKIYRFTYPPENKVLKDTFSVHNTDWPVKPRTKSLITTPSFVYPLGLQDFIHDFYMNLMDLSSTGYIAAVVNNTIQIWNPFTNEPGDIMNSNPNTTLSMVKWNDSGDVLAVGNNSSRVLVWDSQSKKSDLHSEAMCFCIINQMCVINTVAWHPKRMLLISGCSRGILSLCNLSNRKKVRVQYIPRAHSGEIALIRSSPDGKSVASCGEDGFVRIWRWASLHMYLEINVNQPCRAIAWHPWKPSYLVMGKASAMLWNVDKKVMLSEYQLKEPNVINSMEFSSVTGELVIGIRRMGDTNISEESESREEILVMSSLDTVVDLITLDNHHQGCTYYLRWGQDGKELATVGLLAGVVIWPFLGHDEHLDAMRKKKVEKSVSVLNNLNDLNNHGFCIR